MVNKEQQLDAWFLWRLAQYPMQNPPSPPDLVTALILRIFYGFYGFFQRVLQVGILRGWHECASLPVRPVRLYVSRFGCQWETMWMLFDSRFVWVFVCVYLCVEVYNVCMCEQCTTREGLGLAEGGVGFLGTPLPHHDTKAQSPPWIKDRERGITPVP